ncbi:unnamed protein product [Penicillium salamii]|uniref:Non-structural maintenance of chromosomes element 4 n=1 Tax=Penicillium salamii TaxID=1612424 RepID=A0A9W4NY03_9EURO|nr:unnamed protein product [Penicillium salamii]CAG8337397.1 unnamed protein product [Penicillium salamii]CAG8337450.1 unnamed protein product [Penicillium salamii]CAG8387306.1 unnamed protein product [Penicillium salamii]CAG8396002.1 unnamed protein product [Penicillium salamii]
MAFLIHTPLENPNLTTSNQHSSPGDSSDKENPRQNPHKRTSSTMPPPRRQNKRQRLVNRDTNTQSVLSQTSSQRSGESRWYDPDQDPAERQRIRKETRELNREVNDSRSEYMQPGNTGLKDALAQANDLYAQVKQTSDATIDSRLLVNIADLSHKKTSQLALGATSASIDVDEFVSKCISFMRRGPTNAAALSSGTQGQRARHSRSQRDPNASDDDDAGDAMNWDHLGQAACFPHNARPAVPGWLLGPLSIQKRVWQMTQRKVTERIDPSLAVRPQELQQQDLGGQESANLTQICSEINKLLGKNQAERLEKAGYELENTPNVTPDMAQAIMAKHGIADDEGIPLFRFCINPDSFGQSVENLFYVSFLVRDGTVGVSTDSRGLPTLRKSLHPFFLCKTDGHADATAPYAPLEAQRQGIQKHQAVFSLDYDTWEQVIKLLDLKECMIPHRAPTQEETSTSWHG